MYIKTQTIQQSKPFPTQFKFNTIHTPSPHHQLRPKNAHANHLNIHQATTTTDRTHPPPISPVNNNKSGQIGTLMVHRINQILLWSASSIRTTIGLCCRRGFSTATRTSIDPLFEFRDDNKAGGFFFGLSIPSIVGELKGSVRWAGFYSGGFGICADEWFRWGIIKCVLVFFCLEFRVFFKKISWYVVDFFINYVN